MKQVLETKRLVLRPVEEDDQPLLSQWRGSKDYIELISSGQKRNHHAQFMIYLRKNHEPIGVVYTFSYNKVDGYAFLSVFLVDGYRKKGYGAEACALFVCRIFDFFPVHKIYCDAFSSNTQSVSTLRSAGLKQEGFFKGHRLYNGVRYDVVRFAIHRENLEFLRSLSERFRA